MNLIRIIQKIISWVWKMTRASSCQWNLQITSTYTHLVQPFEFWLHSPIFTELPICDILSQISEIALLQCYHLTALEKSPLWSPLCFQISPFSFFIFKIVGFPDTGRAWYFEKSLIFTDIFIQVFHFRQQMSGTKSQFQVKYTANPGILLTKH